MQLRAKLETLADIAESDVPAALAEPVCVAFVFSGQGAQWWGMARSLLAHEPAFREVVIEIDALFKPLAGFSIIEELERGQGTSRIDDTTVAQPAIFAVQVGLTALWKLHGVQPSAVLGHSVGEVAAAYVSGALSLTQAVQVIYQRSHIQGAAQGKGRMLAIGIGHEQATQIVQDYEGVSVAAVNGPNTVTVAGPEKVIQELTAECARAGVFHRLLEVDVPFHSAIMDALKPKLRDGLSSLAPRAETLALYSSVTAARIDGTLLTANYWCDNMREPVLFAPAVRCMLDDGYNAFVEIGSHPIHSGGLTELASMLKVPAVVVPSLRRNDEDVATMSSSLARLYEAGAPIDWRARYEACPELLELPPYPLRRERFWLETPTALRKRLNEAAHPLIAAHTELAHNRRSVWHVNLDSRLHPFIRDHRVQGPIVYPGTGQIELAVTAGKAIWRTLPGTIRDIELKAPVFLPDEGEPPLVQLEVVSEDGKYVLSSRAPADGSQWTVHSTGRIVPDGDVESRPIVDIDALKARLTGSLDPNELHEELWSGGLQLGPTFRATRRIWALGSEALVEIGVPCGLSDCSEFQIHPVLLDAALQMTAAAAYEHKSERELYLPIGVDRVVYHCKPPTDTVYALIRIAAHDAQIIQNDIHVVDEDGKPVISLYGIQYRYIAGTRDDAAALRDRCLYDMRWVKTLRPEDKASAGAAGQLMAPRHLRDALEPLCNEVGHRPLADLYHEHFEPELDRLCDAYIIEALERLDVPFRPGTRSSLADTTTSAGVIERCQPILARFIEILAAHGIVEKVEGEFVVLNSTSNAPPVSAAEILSDLRARYPEFASELQLLARTGPSLPDVLTGRADPVGVLFPADEWQSVVNFYASAFAFAPYNEVMARAFSTIVAGLPSDRVLRVLEIGAGTGGMTQAILRLLPADRTEYTFTDVSSAFLAAAQDRFASYSFMRYRSFDLERDPVAQGLPAGAFDIVIASDVIHATSDIDATLGRIGSLLAPNGLLAALEVTKAPAYLDLTFGLTDGWWAFRDWALRRDGPLLARDGWHAALERACFVEVTSVSDAIDQDRSAQTLFFARSAATPARASAPSGNWLLLADRHGVCARLAGMLSDGGAHVITAPFGTPILDAIAASPVAIAGVVFARGLESDLPVSGTQATDAQSHVLADLVEVYRILGAERARRRLWILTAGAMAVHEDTEVTNPFQAAQWGMARVAMNEHVEVQTILVDLPARSPSDHAADVYAELRSTATEDERALRGDGRYVHVLRRVTADESERQAVRPVAARGGSYRLESTSGAGIENLHLREVPGESPAPGHVLIDVHAVGLNFKDVMNATGLLSDEAVVGGRAGKRLGLECSGLIRDLGAGVSGMARGDAVMALATDCIGGRVSVDARHVLPIPSAFTMEEAAGVPVVYLTAYYALHVLSRLSPGERVLIHSGAGGVGLAAIKIAMILGADVIATVGTEEKEAFVREMGVKWILDSRRAGFADQVRALTDGRGVDVVLNSLAADAIPDSIDCLAPFGRFVEIGKTDIYRDRQIGLKPFGQNLSYFAVDVDRLLNQKPELAAQLFQDVRSFIEHHGIGPHPTRSFPIDDASTALRQLGQGKHIGKIVLSVPEGDVDVLPPERLSLSSSGAYLVTGGTGGFGLAVADWLARNGAGMVALQSRSGRARTEDESTLERLRADGCRVDILRGDVANPLVVAEVMRAIDDTEFKLRGVFHCAMQLDDAPLLDHDVRRFATVLGPKATGAWNLHVACAGRKLDHFVLFSSMAAVYGNAGQAAYAAANAVLDSIAAHRVARGDPATSISWGVIGNIGFVARNDKVQRILASQGLPPLPVDAALELMELCMRHRVTNPVVLRADWPAVGRFFPAVAASSRFADLVHEGAVSSAAGVQGDAASLLDMLRSKNPDDGQRKLCDALGTFVARVLGLAPGTLDDTQSLQNLGFDSLMAAQLSSWIRTQLDIDYSMMKVMRASSVRDLASALVREHGERAPSDVVAVSIPDSKPQATGTLTGWLTTKLRRR